MIGLSHDPDGTVRAAAESLDEQTDTALGHLDLVTTYAGGRRDRVVELSAFVVPKSGEETVRARSEALLGLLPPLLNVRQVDDVALHSLLELDWIVDLHSDRSSVDAAAILSPLGHVETSDPIESGPFLIRNGHHASGATLYDQSRNLLDAISADLTAHGSALDKLVKLTVFIAEFNDYPQFNTATKEVFADFIPPARSVIVAPAVTGEAQLRVDWVALR
jgi:enamine deaminase RidA (YjgF/YER057c/UK114 family)